MFNKFLSRFLLTIRFADKSDKTWWYPTGVVGDQLGTNETLHTLIGLNKCIYHDGLVVYNLIFWRLGIFFATTKQGDRK